MPDERLVGWAVITLQLKGSDFPNEVLGPVLALADRTVRRMRSLLTELRIDVALPDEAVERELDALHERWFLSGASLYTPVGLRLPGHHLIFKTREADGEYFIYAVDPVANKLAAYIVMSRLIEVNRRADRHLRSPHAKVAIAYRRRGITSAVYRWWLASGRSLMSGARQSPAAHELWGALATDYRMIYVSVAGKGISVITPPLSNADEDNIDTRVVLLGSGCRPELFVAK